MELYVITMPDGARWGIPPEIIAKNRAEYYERIDPDTTFQEEYDLMMEWFEDGDFEFQDWAKNNMNWDDVKDVAICLPKETGKVDWLEGWINGDAYYPYEYAVLGEGSGDDERQVHFSRQAAR